jgi:hypothetical protein
MADDITSATDPDPDAPYLADAGTSSDAAASSDSTTSSDVAPPVSPVSEEYKKQIDEQIAEQKRINQESLDHIDTYQKQLAPIIERYQKDLAQPMPQAPTAAPAYPLPPSEIRERQDMGNAALGYMAVAFPLAMLLGRRGRNAGWYALGALGEGMQAVIKGQNARAATAMERYKESVALVQKQSEAAYKQYAAIMENRKMGLDQKLGLMQTVAGVYKAHEIMDAARSKNIDRITGLLTKVENAVNKQHPEAAAKAALTMASKLFNTKDGQAYNSFIHDKLGYFADPRIDDGTSLEERIKRFAEADKVYPFHKFLHQEEFRRKQESQAVKEIDPKTGQLRYRYKPEGEGEGEGETDQDAQSAELDRLFGKKKVQ